jgi:NAD(P)-dependent dehydrogenase (short-subunit alcohol dehydrogenase family)
VRQKALPLLSPGASVIVTGSTASIRPSPGQEVYGATKAAVRSLVRSWALSSKARNFRVNVLSPGPTESPRRVRRLHLLRRRWGLGHGKIKLSTGAA